MMRGIMCGLQVRVRGGPGCRAALPAQVGLPEVRGHLLAEDKQEQGDPPAPAGRVVAAAARQGALPHGHQGERPPPAPAGRVVAAAARQGALPHGHQGERPPPAPAGR
eukprot:1193224-Prorocentrum_minimum.AAC.1